MTDCAKVSYSDFQPICFSVLLYFVLVKSALTYHPLVCRIIFYVLFVYFLLDCSLCSVINNNNNN